MNKTKKNRSRKFAIASTLIFFVLFFLLRDLGLSNAVGYGSLKFTNLMLTLGADPNSWNEGQPILYFAAMDHNPEIVQTLLAHGAHIDQEGEQDETPLMSAIRNDNFDTASYLLSRGASLALKNLRGESAKSLAVKSQDAQIRMLAKKGQQINLEWVNAEL